MEYKALAQNTYKFTTMVETVFNCVGDIGSPMMPAFSRMKIIEANKEIHYEPVVPLGNTTNVAAKSITSYAYVGNLEASKAPSFLCYPICASCVVDGKVYHGYLNARYGFLKARIITGGSLAGPIAKKTHTASTIKVIKYDSSLATIVNESYDFISETHNGANQLLGASFAQEIDEIFITIPKLADDIILGIEIEYSKYDITLYNTSANTLYYSLDDGVTFKILETSKTVTLDKVEHIVFKLDSGGTRNFYQDNIMVGTIYPQSTCVIVPTANGYIEIR